MLKELVEELEIKTVREDMVSSKAKLVKVWRGNAWIKLENKEALFDVWALETLGFKVDSKTGRLEEIEKLLERSKKFEDSVEFHFSKGSYDLTFLI